VLKVVTVVFMAEAAAVVAVVLVQAQIMATVVMVHKALSFLHIPFLH
jgi:hypothetical protein